MTLPRSPPCPFPRPVHRPRAPLSISAPSPPCTFPCTRAPSPCTVILPLPLPNTRAPSPCTVIALCPSPLPAPSLHPCTVPVHRSARSTPVGSAIPPYTASSSFALPGRVGFVIALWRLTVLNENPTPEGFLGKRLGPERVLSLGEVF